MVKNTVDNYVESKSSNVGSSVELEPSIIEVFIDVKQTLLKLTLMCNLL